MKPNSPSHPIIKRVLDDGTYEYANYGLTKREEIALRLYEAIMGAQPHIALDAMADAKLGELSKKSIQMADAFIASMNANESRLYGQVYALQKEVEREKQKTIELQRELQKVQDLQ